MTLPTISPDPVVAVLHLCSLCGNAYLQELAPDEGTFIMDTRHCRCTKFAPEMCKELILLSDIVKTKASIKGG